MKKRPNDMGDIESLLISNAIDSGRWYPTDVGTYRREVCQGVLCNMEHYYVSNIAYSLQYLEYLERQLAELRLSSVIWTMVIKNYVITSASIIEIVFYHIVKENGKLKQRLWKQGPLRDVKSLPPLPDGTEQKLSEVIQTKLSSPVVDTPKFESLISIVRDNHLLVDIDMNLHNGLFKTLRKLRNKVHLTTANDGHETDYWSFEISDYLRTKCILFQILTDRAIGVNSQPTFEKMIKYSAKQVSHYKKHRELMI